MSFKGFITLLFVVALIAGAAGGGAYLWRQRKETRRQEAINEARTLARGDDAEAALEAYAELEPMVEGTPYAEEVDLTRMELLDRLGKKAEAARMAQDFLDEYPKSVRRARPLVLLGDLAWARGAFDEARAHYEKALEANLQGEATWRAELGMARLLARGNSFVQAKERLEALLDKNLPEDLKRSVQDELGTINIQILFSRATDEEDIVYNIAAGDSLGLISKKYNVPMELLMLKNDISDPRRLTVGRRVLVPINRFSMVVDRHSNTLTVLDDGKFFKRYPVRTGMDDYMTPRGEYKIISKSKNPEWVDPKTARRYPPGHAENELGTRWMAFQGSMLGIHGTIHPDSVGLYSSNGCIGMRKEDVEELYVYIPRNTPLKIVGEQNPEIRRKSMDYQAAHQ